MRMRLAAVATGLGALVLVAGVPPLVRSSQAPRTTARPPSRAPGASSKVRDDGGFIRRWLILEPLRVAPQLDERAIQALVKKAPFADLLTAMPRDAERLTIEGESLAWHAVDTPDYNVNLFHFAAGLGRPTSNVLFWIVTAIDAPRDLSGVRLAIGSNAASVWWLNGEEVVGIYDDRQTVIDDGVSKRVTLKKGVNVIRAAVVNGGGATDFCARFVDEDGNPLKGLLTRIAAEGAAP